MASSKAASFRPQKPGPDGDKGQGVVQVTTQHQREAPPGAQSPNSPFPLPGTRPLQDPPKQTQRARALPGRVFPAPATHRLLKNQELSCTEVRTHNCSPWSMEASAATSSELSNKLRGASSPIQTERPEGLMDSNAMGRHGQKAREEKDLQAVQSPQRETQAPRKGTLC